MKILRNPLRYMRFLRQYREFSAQNAAKRPEFTVNWSDRWLQLKDDTGDQPFDGHYIYHTAWAARVLAQTRPTKHVDISSYLYFATIASAFVPFEFYDFRPAAVQLANLHCGKADLSNLHFSDQSVASLSCLHTIEHIGLGRYGDPINATGDTRALEELQRVLAPAGNLLIVVPVGRPRIQYNAHRIYHPQMVVDKLPELSLKAWSLLPDDASQGLLENPNFELAEQQRYGCGCFWFERPTA
ncbi:DUF268 domain-containing protein [Aureliella helgolandensis]|uniref:DUF268 domain-containing protein n=1 Tax=Aureliella helgolandensis TaxID=2527968 RepID=A0A518G7D2_9BACT|nr:DUF268 domain-containing protein [Aureliella helgolandensis]QDV24489.1 hypothetical protein Q31a_28070 [Aureliella helgolandensis]